MNRAKIKKQSNKTQCTVVLLEICMSVAEGITHKRGNTHTRGNTHIRGITHNSSPNQTQQSIHGTTNMQLIYVNNIRKGLVVILCKYMSQCSILCHCHATDLGHGISVVVFFYPEKWILQQAMWKF